MPASYLLLALRALGPTPQARAALLEGTGVEPSALPSEGGEITLGQQLRMLRNANRLAPPGWGLEVGRGFHPFTHGALGPAVASAPTLGASLDVLERFGGVRAPYFRVSTERVRDLVRVAIEERVELDEEERPPLLETLLLAVQGLIESVLGRPISDAAFEFAYAPPAWSARYAEFFHAPVRFGRPETRLTLPAAWLDVPCATADPALFRSSVAALDTYRRRLESDEHLPARLEQVLAAAGDGALSLAEAAQRLHVSRRTLNRRLEALGTSYRAVTEAHRRGRAEALLADATLSISEIGWRLGYVDPSNFGRACRRWFGVGPARVRQRLRR